jgi:hypothetical protein
LADEQAVPMEAKAVLDDNGLRVGQVGGITPPELQALLTSERSCVRSRRIQLHANNAQYITLGSAPAQCRFQLHQDRQEIPVALEKGQYTLAVVPTLTEDGRTKLRFTPQIQTGSPRLLPRPKGDGSFEWQEQRPAENYTALSWEVTLAPNEYVLVGGRFDCPNTLGHASFIRPDEAKPVQRLLVSRMKRPPTPCRPWADLLPWLFKPLAAPSAAIVGSSLPVQINYAKRLYLERVGGELSAWYYCPTVNDIIHARTRWLIRRRRRADSSHQPGAVAAHGPIFSFV